VGATLRQFLGWGWNEISGRAVHYAMEFVREPRLPAPQVAHDDVVVASPPQVPKSVPVNPLARLLPVGMLVAALGMMAVYLTSGTATRSPMYLFFPVMMVTSVIGTLAYGARGSNRTVEMDQGRRGYLNYIDTLYSTVAATADDQRRSTRWNHPEPESLWNMLGGRRMWERQPDHCDFCHVRVGCGDRPLATRLTSPDLGPVEELDPVTVTAMRRLVRAGSIVPEIPLTVALREFSVIVVDGDRNAARALVRAMVCQLSLLHGPNDVTIDAVAGPQTRDEWDWLKWLPHHRYSHVVRDAGQRHRVTILDDAMTADSVAFTGDSTIIDIGGARHSEPNAGCLRLHVDGEHLTVLGDEAGTMVGRADSLTQIQASVYARRQSRYRPAVVSAGKTGLAAVPGWPQLMGIDDPDGLDPENRWITHCDGRIAAVPIGVGDDGTPVVLDINEAARNGMGPHGLCVGATGSGKSEFLRTLALGMITAHPPDVLNLILVDFKGGATFLGLERAPHVSAVITNLAKEAHLVSRMSDALAGEMNRRQELLRSAGEFANVAEYERARSRGAIMPPLPALFIMVDEFSELLSQHPDFADLFVAVGRLGRSLGIHLLLASQRLDEGRLRGLETHLAYRICLKTFSAGESRAVLGIPDAHHLPGAPGAAYLKTASGDLVRFQTSFVSGPLEPRGGPAGPATPPMTPVLFTAEPVHTVRREDDERDVASVPSVLEAMLDRLAGRGTPARRVWLPPLTASPMLSTLADAEGVLTAVIGLVDNPYEQRRDQLVVELGGAAGNVAVVGAPRAGKSTTLRTLLLALAEKYDPAEVGFYCLDFGGGALSSLRRLPHMGAVASRLDVDLCRRTVAVVESVIRAREARFRALGIDSMSDYRRLRAAGDPAVVSDPYGDVFLVVDGWATLRQDFESLERPITAIAAQGLSFGVHVVVAASRWAELRPGLKDQIATRIEMRLGDPAESEMDRRRARDLRDRPAGHGITANGREMVIALPPPVVADTIERLLARVNGRRATPVELLPTLVRHNEVARVVDRIPNRVLLGIGECELEPITIDFDSQQHLLVLGEPGCGKTAVLRLLCTEVMSAARADEAQLEIVDFRRTLLGVVDSDHLAAYTMSPVSLASRLPKLLGELEARMPDEFVTQQQLRTRSWWTGPEIYLVIDDYDLAAAVTGNPLARLADFLPHAQDLGLHVIVARRSGGAARAMFDPVLARMRDVGCMGLMMSASPDEGVLLGSARPSSLPPGRATLVTRDEAQLIQSAWVDPQ